MPSSLWVRAFVRTGVRGAVIHSAGNTRRSGKRIALSSVTSPLALHPRGFFLNQIGGLFSYDAPVRHAGDRANH
jgi:hypothetical protein